MCRDAPESTNHSGLSDEQINPSDAEKASSLSALEPFPVTALASLFPNFFAHFYMDSFA